MRFFLILLLYLKFNSVYAQCGKVISVKDGDTFEMLVSNHKIKVRVAYIDAPEHGQAFGDNAKNFTTQLIYLKQVCIEVKYKDPYGRSVAIVKLSKGHTLNEELLKNGLAWHYTKYSNDKKLLSLEQSAQKQRKGVWSTLHPEAPWKYRKTHHIGKYNHR